MAVLRRYRALARLSAAAVACVTLANCTQSTNWARKLDPKYGVSASPRVVESGEPVPKGGGSYRVGKPYVVGGRTYVPEEDPNYRAEGLASWYGDDFHGRKTANGEVFDMTSISAAHPTMPLPSYARVTNTRNGKSIIVRVNDRGPYHGNRIIDLSYRTAKLLDFSGHGLARVRVEYAGRAPMEGSDDTRLVATLRENAPAPLPGNVQVASARSFVPDMRQAAPVRGDVPVPSGRPYTLGQTVADTSSLAATSEISASRTLPAARSAPPPAPANPRFVRYDAPAPAAQPATGSFSGQALSYAPAAPASGFSGRGLY